MYIYDSCTTLLSSIIPVGSRAPVFTSTTLEAKAGRSLSLSTAWSRDGVPGTRQCYCLYIDMLTEH